MKKLLALLLTLVMCLSLAACGGSGTDTSGTDTSSGETGEDSGDSSYRFQGRLRCLTYREF